MAESMPPVVDRYFLLDADRDVEAIVALFTDDATVIDEGQTRRGTAAIRDWQIGDASRYEYTTEILGSEELAGGGYRVTGRLDGNFPGETVILRFDFTVVGEHISHLRIAP
jgi:hypothetical protein